MQTESKGLEIMYCRKKSRLNWGFFIRFQLADDFIQLVSKFSQLAIEIVQQRVIWPISNRIYEMPRRYFEKIQKYPPTVVP